MSPVIRRGILETVIAAAALGAALLVLHLAGSPSAASHWYLWVGAIIVAGAVRTTWQANRYRSADRQHQPGEETG